MIDAQELERRIQREIIPGNSHILKADGNEGRLVTSNRDREIRMRTGVRTDATKQITYDMVVFAFNILSEKGRFNSKDFCSQFKEEYDDGPCRFTMTGGVLVKLGLANREPGSRRGTCYYTASSGRSSLLGA